MGQHAVILKQRCFAAFSVGGCDVELFVDAIAPGGVTLSIKSTKQLKALRVFQELPGFDQAAKPKLADEDDPLEAVKKRAS